MNKRTLTFGLASLAATAMLAVTAPAHADGGGYVEVDGKQHWGLSGCYNLSELTGSDSGGGKLTNEVGYPIYIHSSSNCKGAAWSATLSGTTHYVGSLNSSVYVPPRPY
ncbi:hypothetical protein [Streptomyces sp. NPDC046939]|uniref:hypothetical protein n=1 Tax=Streptomyces sp. NPDC046939 TaxID=3155376 RepID=UPI0033CF36F6